MYLHQHDASMGRFQNSVKFSNYDGIDRTPVDPSFQGNIDKGSKPHPFPSSTSPACGLAGAWPEGQHSLRDLTESQDLFTHSALATESQQPNIELRLPHRLVE
jgi:hypothetical protein